MSEDRTGKQRFDVERFNQAEFLRLFSQAKNARQHETDESEISRLEYELNICNEKTQLNDNFRKFRVGNFFDNGKRCSFSAIMVKGVLSLR